MNLTEYGWDEHFENAYNDLNNIQLIKARIIADYGQTIKVVTEEGEQLVDRHVHEDRAYGVGDFICLEFDGANNHYSIKELLPRKTKISRLAAGQILKEQIIGANIDTVFIMQSLNNDFNLRRLERYLVAAWESGAMPAVILTKSDLCDDAQSKINEVFSLAAGVEIHSISSITGDGLENVRKYFALGKTVALVGSSGVGKSTLVNALAGKEILKTQEVLRDDDKGRHTTTHRQLVLLPQGGVAMDTPGMRTLGLWEAESGMENIFGDIHELALNCRFRDCKHDNEPGCAVKEALETGALEVSHWINYQKLQKELAHIERKKTEKMREHEKDFAKMIKNTTKVKW